MIRGCIVTISYSTRNPIIIHLASSCTSCCSCWNHSYSYIHLLHFFTLHFFPIYNWPGCFVLLYHPRHYLFTGWNVLAAIVVWRTLSNTVCQCDQKLFGFQSNIFISPSSVWVTCRFCRSCFSCCLSETLPQLTAQQSTSLIYCVTAPNDKVIPWIPKWCIWCQCSQGYSGIYKAGICLNNGLHWVHNIMPHRLPQLRGYIGHRDIECEAKSVLLERYTLPFALK